MGSTSEQIAALKAHGEALKEPLRRRYWELEAIRKPHLDALHALQAQRDASIDDLTPYQNRELVRKIKEARERLAETAAERKEILRALRDEDGKTRLGSAE